MSDIAEGQDLLTGEVRPVKVEVVDVHTSPFPANAANRTRDSVVDTVESGEAGLPGASSGQAAPLAGEVAVPAEADVKPCVPNPEVTSEASGDDCGLSPMFTSSQEEETESGGEGKKTMGAGVQLPGEDMFALPSLASVGPWQGSRMYEPGRSRLLGRETCAQGMPLSSVPDCWGHPALGPTSKGWGLGESVAKTEAQQEFAGLEAERD